jgi:hypothetical protein
MFRFTIRDVLGPLVVWAAAISAYPLSGYAGDTSDRLFPFHGSAGWGYIDREGRVVVTPQFRSARDFSDGLGRVDMPSGSKSFVESSGHIAIELGNRFPTVGNFSEGPRSLLD